MVVKGSPVSKRGMSPIRRIATKALYWGRALGISRRIWGLKWAREDYMPAWRAKVIPKEVKDAIDSEWFSPGASVLDIGCGRGEVAAWVAEQGFDVLGIDFSKPAIDTARAEYSAAANLEFKVMDICREAPAENRFGVLLDRGCFHIIPARLHSAYFQSIAACTKPETRLLLFAPIRLASHEQKIEEMETAFRPMFELIKTSETMLGVIQGVAMWMVRR